MTGQKNNDNFHLNCIAWSTDKKREYQSSGHTKVGTTAAAAAAILAASLCIFSVSDKCIQSDPEREPGMRKERYSTTSYSCNTFSLRVIQPNTATLRVLRTVSTVVLSREYYILVAGTAVCNAYHMRISMSLWKLGVSTRASVSVSYSSWKKLGNTSFFFDRK